MDSNFQSFYFYFLKNNHLDLLQYCSYKLVLAKLSWQHNVEYHKLDLLLVIEFAYQIEIISNCINYNSLSRPADSLVRPKITLQDCLNAFTQTELVEQFYSTAIDGKTTAKK